MGRAAQSALHNNHYFFFPLFEHFAVFSLSFAHNQSGSLLNALSSKTWDVRRKAGGFWSWNEIVNRVKTGAQKLWLQLFCSLRCWANLEMIILTFGFMLLAVMLCPSPFCMKNSLSNSPFACAKSGSLSWDYYWRAKTVQLQGIFMHVVSCHVPRTSCPLFSWWVATWRAAGC